MIKLPEGYYHRVLCKVLINVVPINLTMADLVECQIPSPMYEIERKNKLVYTKPVSFCWITYTLCALIVIRLCIAVLEWMGL